MRQANKQEQEKRQPKEIVPEEVHRVDFYKNPKTAI